MTEVHIHSELVGALAEYRSKVARIKSEIIGKIAELPDNPRITRLGTSGKCFTISNVDLGNNWTPAYHDFRFQYGVIIAIIDNYEVEQALGKIQHILDKGWTRVDRKMGDINPGTFTFHPDVIKNLKSVFG